MLSMNERTIEQLRKEYESTEKQISDLRKKMVDWFSIPKKEGDAMLAEHDRCVAYLADLKTKLRRAGWQG